MIFSSKYTTGMKLESTINPPHSRDLMLGDDSNYNKALGGSEDMVHSLNAIKDQFVVPAGMDDNKDVSASIHSSFQEGGTPSPWTLHEPSPRASSSGRVKGVLLPNIMPLLLNSSHMTDLFWSWCRLYKHPP